MNKNKKIKIYINILFCAFVLTLPLITGAIEEPVITVWPETYVAGEEKFYIEGTSFPQMEVMLFVEKDNNILKEWQVFADDKGEWLLAVTDLLKPGIYYLFSQARDANGAVSEFSPKQRVEVIFSGLILGPLLITFRKLASGLIIALLILIILAVRFILRNLKARKSLKKETEEAEESLHKGFDELRKDIKRELGRLEGIKSQRELSKKEQEIIQNLKEDLKKAEKLIGKEIKDVEKELE